jgi:hypothetical protein
MATTSQNPTAYRSLGPADRDPFAQICGHARSGLRDVIDLMLIHNEQSVRGDQPRSTLNRLIAFLSVAAWERFIADLGGMSQAPISGPHPAPGTTNSRRGGAYLSAQKTGSGNAVDVLDGTSTGSLPGHLRLRLPESGSGKRLTFGQPLTGMHPDLVDSVNWWIGLRNGVAHRSVAKMPTWLYVSDATASQGKTVNTTTARFAFALFAQLMDRSMQGVAEAAGMTRPAELGLPADWLTGQLLPSRGVTDPDQLRLWSGPSLVS